MCPLIPTCYRYSRKASTLLSVHFCSKKLGNKYCHSESNNGENVLSPFAQQQKRDGCTMYTAVCLTYMLYVLTFYTTEAAFHSKSRLKNALHDPVSVRTIRAVKYPMYGSVA